MVFGNSNSVATHHPYFVPGEMSYEIFCRFRDFVTANLGIKMPDIKKTMLQSRLQKRLRALNIASYEEYYDYVFSIRGKKNELSNMIDAVTTNKTDFFREPKHFTYLEQIILPNLLRTARNRDSKVFKFWSAGCSSGAEPYTLAMVLSEFASRHPGFRFSILATDISRRVLDEAKNGTYTLAMVNPIPSALQKKYMLKNNDTRESAVRIKPELKAKVTFGRLNFMSDDFGLGSTMDIIFCRNVMIYFDRPTQEKVVNRFCRYLKPGGYLFIGHSETLKGLKVPLTQMGPTIYRK